MIILSLPLSKCYLSTRNEKPALSNSSDLRGVFEKLHFRDGLVWMVGLTVEELDGILERSDIKFWVSSDRGNRISPFVRV